MVNNDDSRSHVLKITSRENVSLTVHFPGFDRPVSFAPWDSLIFTGFWETLPEGILPYSHKYITL